MQATKYATRVLLLVTLTYPLLGVNGCDPATMLVVRGAAGAAAAGEMAAGGLLVAALMPELLRYDAELKARHKHSLERLTENKEDPPRDYAHMESATPPSNTSLPDHIDTAPNTPSSVSTSNVWYTVRPGEGIGDVLNFLHEPAETIVELNADVSNVATGRMIRLPETRYMFHRANGLESYRDIAARYGMASAELLRWCGLYTNMDVLLASMRDCPPEGCDDECAMPSVGELLLVRRRH